MIMQMQQLPRLPCLADHLYGEVDEGPAAVAAASCVPAQRMLASGSTPRELHTDSAHNRNCAHRNHTHTLPFLTHIHTQNHPHCAESTPTQYTFAHNSHTHYSPCETLPTLSPHNLDDFTPLGTLGRGNMGTVILVVSKHSPHSPFALKITHSMASKKQRSHVEREILSSLHHPFLQTLHAHFDSGRHSLLLLDFCAGGDLNLLRHRQPEKRFSETAARFYAAEVLVALEHLHKLGIVYRDLKPENILLQGSGHIKLTDFDLSLRVGTGRNVSTQYGPSAAAPILSLQQQLEAEADEHLKLQIGTQRLHCSAFACLRGYTSRNKEAAQGGFKNQKEEKGCACGTAITGGVGLSRQRGVCSVWREQAQGRIRTRKKGTDEGCLSSKENSFMGRNEARKGRKMHMPSCLVCIKSKKEIFAEEKSVCVVGTDEYVAPEVLRGEEHGFPMDWWSFGIFLYEMVYGYTPFKGATTEETLYNILEKEPEFPGMKSPAKNLIAQLLVKNPASRLGSMGAQDIKRHPFFDGLHWESLPHICRPPFLPSPLCLSEVEERYSAKIKAKREAQTEHKLADIACKSWLQEIVESLEAAENSSQYSQTSSSVGFISSSADGGDPRELRRDDDIEAVFSSTEWSSELDVCKMHHAPLT